VWDLTPAAAFGNRVFRGHRAKVLSVQWSPDGSLLASGGRDGSVLLWDPLSGTCLPPMEGHRESVFQVVWSPDSARLVTCGDDFSVRIWSTGREPSSQMLAGQSLAGQAGQAGQIQKLEALTKRLEETSSAVHALQAENIQLKAVVRRVQDEAEQQRKLHEQFRAETTSAMKELCKNIEHIQEAASQNPQLRVTNATDEQATEQGSGLSGWPTADASAQPRKRIRQNDDVDESGQDVMFAELGQIKQLVEKVISRRALELGPEDSRRDAVVGS